MTVGTLFRSPVALGVALLMATTTYPTLAQAAKDMSTKPAAAAKATTAERDLMKLSDNGFQAMRDVRAARVDIFNGNPQAAHDQLAAAQTALALATKEAPLFVVDVKTGMGGKIVDDTTLVDKLDAIPIDGRIVLADNFVDTPSKKAHIDKANAHIAGGRSKDAIDELKLAEIDASYTRVLMPLQATVKQVNAASKLLGEKKFYEANLALKAAEDGLRMDTLVLTETPKAKVAAKTQQ